MIDSMSTVIGGGTMELFQKKKFLDSKFDSVVLESFRSLAKREFQKKIGHMWPQICGTTSLTHKISLFLIQALQYNIVTANDMYCCLIKFDFDFCSGG